MLKDNHFLILRKSKFIQWINMHITCINGRNDFGCGIYKLTSFMHNFKPTLWRDLKLLFRCILIKMPKRAIFQDTEKDWLVN